MIDASKFEEDVIRHFAFLERDFGFHRNVVQSNGREHYVCFDGPVGVTVSYEAGSGPWVSVESPVPSPPHPGTSFGLHELVQEVERSEGRKLDPIPAANEIEALGKRLFEIGQDVLRGDVSIILNRKKRLWDAVRRGRSG